MKQKLIKRKKLLNKAVYTFFSSGVLYAGWQFLSTPRTAEYIEQRQLYAMETWFIFAILVIFALVNVHYQISQNSQSERVI